MTVRTSPVDRRFPTTNQTKHCWARYLEFHACAAAKDADDPECAKFKRWYRSLCPEEWVRSVYCIFLCSLFALGACGIAHVRWTACLRTFSRLFHARFAASGAAVVMHVRWLLCFSLGT